MKLLMLLFFYSLITFTFAQDFGLITKLLQQKKDAIHNTTDSLSIDPTLTENKKWTATTSLPIAPLHILSSEIQITDSVYFWDWDASTLEWYITGRLTDFVYNANHQPEQYTIQFRDENNWENYIRFVDTYDATGNKITESMQDWDGEEWINQYLTAYTYDELQNQTSQIFTVWDDDVWRVTSRNIYTYDTAQNRTSTLRQFWNDGWDDIYREVYTYDKDDNLTRILEQNWHDTIWTDRRQILNTFDHLGNQLFDLIQEFDGTEWFNYTQSGFEYDLEYNRIYHLYQRWNGIEWENRNQYFYTFDDAHNQATSHEQIWRDTTWETYSQSTFTHDENNFRLSEVYFYFEDGDPIAAYGDSTYYYYHVVTGTEDASPTINEIVLYPNPSSGLINITMESDIVSVAVYTLTGKKIFQPLPFTDASNIEINLSGQPKGMYFLQVRTSSGLHSARVIIQ